jgi:hypothetical protein
VKLIKLSNWAIHIATGSNSGEILPIDFWILFPPSDTAPFSVALTDAAKA